ncbi:MAG: hypothetical protein JOZ90_16175 [Alphaproteobacteria bacterium]|nr:hypothetical protein [Alphaproteobacteria bacterium]MBV9373348.1 hypothetical protein [Alphaproteobacteria bacterium]MBV9902611.1 hypothetical protein [Alphaproteobacteria bacterium]
MADDTDPAPGELLDRLSGRLATVLVLCAGIVGLSLYAARPSVPRYEAVGLGADVVRLDRRTGAMIACNLQRCVNLHQPGGRIERSSPPAALPTAAPAPAGLPPAVPRASSDAPAKPAP